MLQRRQASKISIFPEILAATRSQLVKYLKPAFGDIPLNEITVVINQIMKEAVRDGLIEMNPFGNGE